MYITDTRPVKVNAFVIPFDFEDRTQTHHASRHDTAAVIICRMNDGSVMKSLHGALRGHGNYVRIHGNQGVMENCRHGDKNRLRVWKEPWEKRKSEPREVVYLPDFPHHHDAAVQTGHSGGDFFTSYSFSEAIRKHEQPYLDVFRAVDMSIVGILAWKSALEDSMPIEVPDFRKKSVQKKYAGEDWSPDPTRNKPGQPPISLQGDIDPSPQARDLARKIWRKQGYEGD
jgi:hypothetical protein